MKYKNSSNLNTKQLTKLTSKEHRDLADAHYKDQLRISAYMGAFISDSNGYQNQDAMKWRDDNGKSWPYVGRLYHANSAPTSFDYIRRGCIYSRQKGEGFGVQTAQRSDNLDKKLGIYNDILGNMNIPMANDEGTGEPIRLRENILNEVVNKHNMSSLMYTMHLLRRIHMHHPFMGRGEYYED